jgi:hypothetical protein
MSEQWPIALQVAFFAASGAIVVLAAVVVAVALRVGKDIDRLVTAALRVEAELTPLARETRVVVDRLRELSAGAQRAAEAAGGLLLPPVLLANRAARILRNGVTTFVSALWNGRARADGGAERS